MIGGGLMRKYLYIILSCLVAITLLSEADMDAKKVRKSKKDKTETADTVAKKTPYQKFLEKKGLEKESGVMTIYKSGNDVFLEIPDSLIGRKVLTSTRVSSSESHLLFPGMVASSDAVYVLDKTDSLLLFRQPSKNLIVKDGDKNIIKALDLREPVVFAFAIKYRNADSTAVVVNASKMFDFSDKKVFNMRGQSYDDNRIADAAYKSELALLREVVSFGQSVGVVKNATYELTLAGIGGELAYKPTVTADFLSSITLLPEDPMPVREADQRIGTKKISYTAFDSDGGTKKGQWAYRWNVRPKDETAYFNGEGSEVENPIKIYVDTLLGPTWTKAVTEGIMAWEPAFAAIGLRNAIVVEPYPSDASFKVEDPLASCVVYSQNRQSRIGASFLIDKTTGQILSCKITVPADYQTIAFEAGVFAISDVDTRYQSYHISDDAVCEVLKAQMMGVFGQCLGLSPNMAGSYAYSPEQLLDPEFTSEHGITASVTDNVIFNYIAKPGDKERGVTTIVDKIGSYDKFAIEWLYRPFRHNESHALDSLLASKAGIQEYLYLPVQYVPLSIDPRGISNDLGNDVFAAYEAGMSHLKFVAANADKWFDDDNIPDWYKELFPERLWVRFVNLTNMFSTYVGGMMTNYMDSGLPKIEPVPADIQRKAIYVVAENMDAQPWFDANKNLLHMSGLTRSVAEFSKVATVSQFCRVFSRLPYVAMAHDKAGSAYSPEEYLDDLRDIFMKDVRKGKIGSSADEKRLRLYMLLQVVSYSSVMTQDYNDAMDKGFAGIADVVDIKPEIKGISVDSVKDLEALCYQNMKEIRQSIKTGISVCRDSYTRYRLEYLLSIADAALGNKK